MNLIRRATASASSVASSVSLSAAVPRGGVRAVPVPTPCSTSTCDSRGMASDTRAKAITMENINPNIVKLEYAVRGPLVIRAAEIEKELEKVTSLLPSATIARNVHYLSYPSVYQINGFQQKLGYYRYSSQIYLMENRYFPLSKYICLLHRAPSSNKLGGN